MTLETAIFVCSTLAIVAFGLWHSWWHGKREERRHLQVLEEARTRGLDVPTSLHPVIDPGVCIGSGACVLACPEQDVLGLISSRGALVGAANCIGHGRCAASCPVDAITLVFGTAKRGVELPQVSGEFETSVPGMYIAGELGGMGLIANAFEQAIQAVDAIRGSLADEPGDDKSGGESGDESGGDKSGGESGGEPDDVDGRDRGRIYDVLVVGAGPAGLGAALRAKELGLDYLCIEQGVWGGAVRTYPRNKIVMTRPVRVPLYGPVKLRETSKEALLELWDRILAETGVEVLTETRLVSAVRSGGIFRVETSRGIFLARRVLLAIGRRGTPRTLGVPGEDSTHVTSLLIEPERWAGLRAVVVGGGDVAVEAALTLGDQPGTSVTLVHRGAVFNRPKAKLRDQLEEARASGRVEVLVEARVQAIERDKVRLVSAADDAVRDVPCEQVLVCIGGRPPSQLLSQLGVQMVTKFGEA